VGTPEDLRCAEPGRSKGKIMNWAYLLSGVIAFALFIYLFVALLKPEKFE